MLTHYYRRNKDNLDHQILNHFTKHYESWMDIGNKVKHCHDICYECIQFYDNSFHQVLIYPSDHEGLSKSPVPMDTLMSNKEIANMTDIDHSSPDRAIYSLIKLLIDLPDVILMNMTTFSRTFLHPLLHAWKPMMSELDT